MPPPGMIVVAGPPGGGKSSIFPVAVFGVPFFNADDRAAQLNGGSHVGIGQNIRAFVNREFEKFILTHIGRRLSFALETTLRSSVTFDQARLAKANGFVTQMRFVAVGSLDHHLARVKMRADAGGHAASERVLRPIYEASMANLRRAMGEFDELRAYDNSYFGGPPRLVLECEHGEIAWADDNPPEWLLTALAK